MFEQVKEILIKELSISSPDKVTRDAKLSEDLGIDSIDAIELVMKLEEEYSIQISDEKIKDVKTFGELVDYVETLVK